jgi:hypothetical protein
MATRSTIALEYADGTIGQVYCHWDGYLEHNGRILFESYQDPFKLRELIDLGDVSVLHANIGEKHDFNQRYEDGCTFYGRDRGETGVGAKNFRDFDHYLREHQWEGFEYILRKDGNWYVSCYPTKFVYSLLSEALAKQKETV